MENASKALLIAGAILLVIAIIGIGMAIFGQAQTVVGQTGTQIDTMAVQAHNSMFDNYVDKTNVKGKSIKELCAKIANYNQNADIDYQVTITLGKGSIPVSGTALTADVTLVDASGLATTGEGEAAVTNVSTNIQANKNYTVTADMNVSGVIKTVKVQQTGTSGS